MPGKTITTVQGDAWDTLCQRLGWPQTYIHHLARANPAYLDVVLFDQGVVLSVPEVEVAAADLLLPAWKRR